MMIRAQVDDSTPMAKAFFTPATFIQDYFSVYRGWKMFAPDPLRQNFYVDALIEYRNGEKKVFKFPAPKGHFERYFLGGERYRKFVSSGVRQERNKKLWPDTARWILKKAGEEDASRIPARIHLRRNWQDIPKMEKDFLPHLSKNMQKWKQYRFFSYEVL